jgi:hypothetical protein
MKTAALNPGNFIGSVSDWILSFFLKSCEHYYKFTLSDVGKGLEPFICCRPAPHIY